MSELETMALYLNIATDKLKATQSQQWLTGNATAFVAAAGASQETQCMVVGNALWIANNADGDTAIQKDFLDLMGINSYTSLLAHAEGYATRLLDSHAGTVRANQGSPKKTVLHLLLGGGTPAVVGAYVSPGAVANSGYAIPNDTSVPPVARVPASSGIVFVRGAYQGDAAGSCHAEQKLLAALGLYMMANENFKTPVRVAGCKMACGTCRPALAAVAERVKDRRSMTLRYESAHVDKHRATAQIGVDNNAGIRTIDVDHYFP